MRKAFRAAVAASLTLVLATRGEQPLRLKHGDRLAIVVIGSPRGVDSDTYRAGEADGAGPYNDNLARLGQIGAAWQP